MPNTAAEPHPPLYLPRQGLDQLLSTADSGSIATAARPSGSCPVVVTLCDCLASPAAAPGGVSGDLSNGIVMEGGGRSFTAPPASAVKARLSARVAGTAARRASAVLSPELAALHAAALADAEHSREAPSAADVLALGLLRRLPGNLQGGSTRE